MDSVIDFKRDVYQKALQELARFLRRRNDERPRHRAVTRTLNELPRDHG